MHWSELIRSRREARGLTQAQLARELGASTPAVASWETARRKPSPEMLDRLAQRLGLEERERAAIVRALGREPGVGRRYANLARLSRPLPTLSAEMDTYRWPALLMNENFEIVAWNRTANAVAELDFATDLAGPGERHLLRMAASRHFYDKLTNWDAVIGHMVGMYKKDAFVIGQPAANPYFQALMADMARYYPALVPRLFNLWATAGLFRDGWRNQLRIEWLTSDRTVLCFNTVFTPWDDFDAAWAFDWHPADGRTWQWLDARRASAPHGGDQLTALPGPEEGWRAVMRVAREAAGLSRAEAAVRSRGRLSKHTVEAYELGRRVPTREKLLAFAEALRLPGVQTNTLLLSAGLDPEPSDFARFIMGETPRFDPARYSQPGGTYKVPPRTQPSIREEIEGHAWPAMVVDRGGNVFAANAPMRKLLRLTPAMLVQPGVRRNLLYILTRDSVRAHMTAWPEALSAIRPLGTNPYGSRDREGAAEASLRDMSERLRADPALLEGLQQALGGGDEMRVRATTQIGWRSAEGEWRFNCVVSPFNTHDPYWVIDWHPADGATWRGVRNEE